jgi:hypothetical protein
MISCSLYRDLSLKVSRTLKQLKALRPILNQLEGQVELIRQVLFFLLIALLSTDQSVIRYRKLAVAKALHWWDGNGSSNCIDSSSIPNMKAPAWPTRYERQGRSEACSLQT